MVVFEIDDSRVRGLVGETLKRVFRHEINKIVTMFGESIPERSLDSVFNFYFSFMRRVKLIDRLAAQGPACAPIRIDGIQEKGSICIFLPRSVRNQYGDDELVGIRAHELGHLYNQFHYGESFDAYVGEKAAIEEERSADEATMEDLGFKKEIKAMRAKMPLTDT